MCLRQLNESTVHNGEMNGFVLHLQNEQKEAFIKEEPGLHAYSIRDVDMWVSVQYLCVYYTSFFCEVYFAIPFLPSCMCIKWFLLLSICFDKCTHDLGHGSPSCLMLNISMHILILYDCCLLYSLQSWSLECIFQIHTNCLKVDNILMRTRNFTHILMRSKLT